MSSSKEEMIVMSVGGSLIVPDDVDARFVRMFRELLVRETKKGRRFIVITGGGKVCRRYQAALKKIGNSVKADLDWLGIAATHLNARLVQLALGKLAHPTIVTDPNIKTAFKTKVLVGGGWKPGRSTDDDAIRLAKLYGARTVINLSNIDYVYDSDPRINEDAKKLERLTWGEYRKMFSGPWEPGHHAPFDSVASKLAQQQKMRVVLLNGGNLNNLKNYLDGKKFIGTVIE